MRLLCVAGLVAISTAMIDTRPASALTARENFIKQVYEDFLFRGPSSSELVVWNAVLDGHSRTETARLVLGMREFADTWISAVDGRYLGEFDSGEAVIDAQIEALYATGNFLEAEVTALATTEYFNESGGTNGLFVAEVFRDLLAREADPGGLAYWTGRLDAATASRSFVARSILRSNESAALRVAGPPGASPCAWTELTEPAAVGAGSYCIILDRLADPAGASHWTANLSSSGQLPDLWAALAGSNEYYANAQL